MLAAPSLSCSEVVTFQKGKYFLKGIAKSSIYNNALLSAQDCQGTKSSKSQQEYLYLKADHQPMKNTTFQCIDLIFSIFEYYDFHSVLVDSSTLHF